MPDKENVLRGWDREKVIKDLEFCVNGHFKVELSLATKILAMLKEQEGIIKQYQKADGFLFAHGWKWEGR